MNADALSRELTRMDTARCAARMVQDQIAILLIGTLFWIEARTTGGAFSERVFGEFALRFPAEMWAAWMMAGSAIIMLGLKKPERHWMIAFGSILQCLQYLALGYSAIMTGGEMVIGLHCTMYFAPSFMRTFVEAVRDDA